ncbi:MAG: hypothetical protein WCP85_09630 [Mariniphaga sp.]
MRIGYVSDNCRTFKYIRKPLAFFDVIKGKMTNNITALSPSGTVIARSAAHSKFEG